MTGARRTSSDAHRPGVVGYVRVSTDEYASSGLGLEAQEQAIRANAESRQIRVLVIYRDERVSARTLKLPGLSAALEALHRGDGSVLMVARLDRLTRSVHDATALIVRAGREGWGLVALDVAVDTTTRQGAAMAQVLAVFAELERRSPIRQRTRDALAVRRSQGARLGRPSVLPEAVVSRIIDERRSGATWTAIADGLERDAVPTAHGGARWHANTVRKVFLANTSEEVRT
jgi:DNA invertase Pin-like site-specific DNA recombinase